MVILLRLLPYILTIASLGAGGWYIYTLIGDRAIALFQAEQLMTALEIDDREDKKTDLVLKNNRIENERLRREKDELSRKLSERFKSDPCWNHPLPSEFIRMYGDRDSEGVPTFTFHLDASNTKTKSDD